MKSFVFRCLYSMPLGLLISTGCTAGEVTMEETSVSEDPGIVAGHSEPSFTEYFNVKLRLPVQEAEFRSLLEENGIEFRVIDSSNRNSALPSLRHRNDVDFTAFKKMYEIHGGVDAHRRIGKWFRAYVDSNGMVVYIENAFSYTGT